MLVALIAAVPATIAALGVWRIRHAIKIPSGGTIGQKVERTHDLAAVNTKTLHKLDGGLSEDEPGGG